MAKFDFVCNKCNATSELDTKNETLSCPECNSTDLKKIYVPITAIYKASGFYSNS